MLMPDPDQDVIDRRDAICAALKKIVPAACVIDSQESMRAYDADGLSAYRQLPLAVVLPETVEQIAAVMKWCKAEGVKVVPRGAGTSLSGGALPLADAVLLGLGKFNRILEVDYDNRCVVAQPGVTNLAITHAVQGDGFYYAPDPSSQIACSVGGNVAENSGGVHCLKYGLTTNNLLGIEMVTMDGEILRLGGKHLDAGDYDLMGVMTGSEGLLGVVVGETIPESWSLTFAIPLTFIAIIAPSMRTRAEIAAAVSAGSLSIIGQPLPWNSWLVIAALGGIAVGGLVNRHNNSKRLKQ